MSAQILPEFVRPDRMAGAGAELEGEIPLSSFGRLCDCLLQSSGTVQVTLRFSRDERRQVQLDGCAATQVSMACQRCLQMVTVPIETQIALTMIAGEELAERVPEDRDALILDQTATVSLAALLEDELLLALPAVARHTAGECEIPAHGTGVVVAEEHEASRWAADSAVRKNPFAGLKALQTGPADDEGNDKNNPPQGN